MSYHDLLKIRKFLLKSKKMSNPFSDVSYEELLTLHREEKKKNDEHIRELTVILNRVLYEIFVFFAQNESLKPGFNRYPESELRR